MVVVVAPLTEELVSLYPVILMTIHDLMEKENKKLEMGIDGAKPASDVSFVIVCFYIVKTASGSSCLSRYLFSTCNLYS